MSMDVKSVTIALGDPGGDNKKLFALKAPAANNGGGITILEASAVNGAATDAGTSFSLALHKYSSAGTPALNGTIAAAVGGTATPFGASVPQAFTISSGYVSAGEWVVLQYNEQASGNPTNGFVTITYAAGK